MIDYQPVLFLGLEVKDFIGKEAELGAFIKSNQLQVVLTNKHRCFSETTGNYKFPFYKDWRTGKCISGFKGQEVLEFVNEYKIYKYIILDTDSNYFSIQPLIKVPNTGLTTRELEIANEYLNAVSWSHKQEIIKNQFFASYPKSYPDIYTHYES